MKGFTMLVLTRKAGERLFVVDKLTGAVIELQVNRIGGLGVRLGITASSRFDVVREEILSDEQREDMRRQAAPDAIGAVA